MRAAGAGIAPWLGRAEAVVAAGVTAATAALYVVAMRRGGGLWRDEVNTVNVATAPTLREMWAGLDEATIPVLWPLVLRGWASLGPGATDESYRVLGLLVGLALLAALWWHARVVGAPWPSLSVVLVAASPVMIRWATSARAYGLGAVLVVVASGLFWRTIQRPSPGRVAGTALAAVLAAHALFSNWAIVGALLAGAAAAGLVRRDRRVVAAAAVVGALALVSVLPYVPVFRARAAWVAVTQMPVALEDVVGRFGRTLVLAGLPGATAGLVVAGVALAGCALPLARWLPRPPGEREALAAYTATTVVAGSAGTLSFLVAGGHVPVPWHFVSLLALVAPALDTGIGLMIAGRPLRAAVRGAVTVLLAAVLVGPAWAAAGTRHTSVDLVARALAASAAPGDLVVLTPWWLGTSFARYASPATRWTTMPEIPPGPAYRYDRLKEHLVAPATAGTPVLARVADTLRAGGRVWVVGVIPGEPPAEALRPPPPAPSGRWGWLESPYLDFWAAQLAAETSRRAGIVRRVALPRPGPVNVYEDPPVAVAEGWR
jgi:hypothetical protein